MAEQTDTPTVACSLTDEALRRRRAMLRDSLLSHLAGSERWDAGLQLRFPDTTALRSHLQTFVDLERQCCGFLTFTITPAENRLVLTIEGPPAAQPTIDMFTTWIDQEETRRKKTRHDGTDH